MDYRCKTIKDEGRDALEIIDFKPDARRVEIFTEQDGLPLVSISKRALSKADCIREFILHIPREDYSLAKLILSQTERFLRLRFIHSSGRLELSFPGFYSNYIEDTMARAIHYKIEGCGYAYRECVMRDRIDVRSYDALFSRAKADDVRVAQDIAISRLRFPMMLSEQAKDAYEAYVHTYATDIVTLLISEQETERLAFLFSAFSFPDAVVAHALKVATEKNQPAMVAEIMRHTRRK